MANFGKFGNLSSKGWNESTSTQTIVVGQHAHIGLWGGGPAGDDLEVNSGRMAVCVVHEEPRPRAANWRHFLLTGLTVGESRIDAYLPGTSQTYSAPITVKVVGHAAVSMVFFPGERLVGSTTVGAIYAVGASGESIEAAGGPPVGGPDRGGHTIDPTPAGHYVLGPKIHVTTRSWPSSVIPWEAPLRLNADGEAEWQGANKAWRLATGPKGEITAAQTAFNRRGKVVVPASTVVTDVRAMFIDPDTGALFSTTWLKNDFGRWGWNLRRNGQPTAYYIHTTPNDERASAQGKSVFLSNSHGCIHLNPKERDQLMAAGVLKQGTPFEVRPYTETNGP